MLHGTRRPAGFQSGSATGSVQTGDAGPVGEMGEMGEIGATRDTGVTEGTISSTG